MTSPAADLPPAVRAFDRRADQFDGRYGTWLSVAAQRRAVQRYVRRVVPQGSRILELGGGTGDDGLFLLGAGYRLLWTDGSPRMVELATAKFRAAGMSDAVAIRQAVLEDLDSLVAQVRGTEWDPCDAAFSNFAALNCVTDLSAIAAPLGRLLRPGAPCLLVVFGPASIGEVVVELARGRPAAAVRRFRRRPAPARLGGEHFQVWYPSPGQVARALAPWFRLRHVRGIGIAVPPSAAEPWISRFPRLIGALEAADRLLDVPLARIADHVLLHFERTMAPVPDTQNENSGVAR